MSAPALRPLRIGEILDAGIKVYLKNARTLIGLTAVVVVPFQILSAIVLLSTVSNRDQVPTGFASLGVRHAGTDRLASLGASATLGVTGAIVGLLTTAACVKAVSDIYLDHPPDIRSSLRFVLRRVGGLVWLQILLAVLLVLAFLALVIPGIWLYVAWSVATPALLIEGSRGLDALGRSFRLVRDRWWSSAAVLIVTAIMVSVVSGAIQGILLGLSLTSGGSVALTVILVSLAAAISAILTRPLQAAVTTILYYDLRVRHEGYDVALLAQQLGIEPAALPVGLSTDGGPESAGRGALPGGLTADAGPKSVGQPGGPPFWPPPPGWSPPTGAPGAGGES